MIDPLRLPELLTLSDVSCNIRGQVSSLAGTPTGKVEYLNGTTVLSTMRLTSGSAKYTTSKLPPGTNSITAVYEGDSNNSSSTSAPVYQFVIAATTTTLTSSPNPSIGWTSAIMRSRVETHGARFCRGKITSPGEGVLRVENGTGEGAALRLYDVSTEQTIRCLFVKANESVRITGK